MPDNKHTTKLTTEQLHDLSILENELRNHIYNFVCLKDNVRSYATFLSVPDLREISSKAAKTARKVLTRIAIDKKAP